MVLAVDPSVYLAGVPTPGVTSVDDEGTTPVAPPTPPSNGSPVVYVVREEDKERFFLTVLAAILLAGLILYALQIQSMRRYENQGW